MLGKLSIHTPKPMKDKFEEAIIKVLYVNRLHEIKTIPTRVKVMAKACNTFHQQAMKEEREKHEEIYKWLLGYMNFPIRRIGMGAWHWRKDLRKKLKSSNIEL